MEFSAVQIATFLSGTVEGDPEVKVYNVAKIEEGAPGMLSFLANPKYSQYLYTTKSSIVLINNDFELQGEVTATLIRVPDAYAAFAQLLGLYQQFMQSKTGVSSLAFISKDATYGDDVYIGEFAFIGERVKIGNRVKIYPQAYIGDDAVIGDDTIVYAGAKLYAQTVVGKSCILHSGCVIGADGFGFAPQEDGSYKKIPQIGNVSIGDNVEIGANTCVDCATMGSTRIHNGVKLDNLIQVAHNVELGNNTAMAAQTGVSGSTKIGANCIVAGQVGIAGHLHIANNTKIGAQSGIISNIKREGEEVMGSPVMPVKDFLRMSIHLRQMDKLVRRIEELEKKLNEKQ
ncbi:MAG: UDP-3-O-(3-hydroxymyristoyl)glucosamine N-acyltransferase [Bacteroidales bacterium]|nr:UDP-3-O-(3-hydroxymyristoyl)glucosamine N-acyltransferase [Lentimicrobiaceae bacterium]MBQ2852876.1 UDP-3-O-(3-hydroxymyristoyl)glucosamine N-acyltransferase [Bacteroidales bacterium]